MAQAVSHVIGIGSQWTTANVRQKATVICEVRGSQTDKRLMYEPRGSIQRRIVEIHGALHQQWSDNGVLAAVWKHELLERRAAHCSNDWSQDVTGALDKPSGYRVQFTLLVW